jgi:hypothetical protein
MAFKRGDCVRDNKQHTVETHDGKPIEGATVNFGRGIVVEAQQACVQGQTPLVKVFFDDYKLGPIWFPTDQLEDDKE